MLAARDVRIAEGGASVFEVSFDVGASRRVALIGDWSPLFRALLGAARIEAGDLTIADQTPERALRAGTAAVAPAELSLIDDWTVSQYLQASAALVQGRCLDPVSCLRSFALEAMRTRRLGTLHAAERRVLSVMQASLTKPRVMLLETPFLDLDETGQSFLFGVLQRLPRETLLVASYVTEANPGGASPAETFLRSCDVALVVDRGRLVASTAAADLLGRTTRYRVTAVGEGAPDLGRHLEDAGVSVQSTRVSALVADMPGATSLVVTVDPSIGTASVLDAAASVGATVVELVPLRPSV